MANNKHHKTGAVQEDALKNWSRPHDMAGHFGLGNYQTSGVYHGVSLLPDFQDCGDVFWPSYSPHREREKKGSQNLRDTSASKGAGVPVDTLAAFHERLRDLCRDDGVCHGTDRNARIHAQAQHALALAGELGCLKDAGVSWQEFLALCTDAVIGTEHMVELDARAGLVGKTTVPPGFGLVPELRRHSLAVLRPDADAPREGYAIEFHVVLCDPDETLERYLGIFPK